MGCVYQSYREISDPMKLVSGRQTVHDHACRADDHGWKHNAETHFGFADAVVADGETRCQAIGAV